MQTTATAWSAAMLRVLEAKDQLVAAIRYAHELGASNQTIRGWVNNSSERLAAEVSESLVTDTLEGTLLVTEGPQPDEEPPPSPAIPLARRGAPKGTQRRKPPELEQ